MTTDAETITLRAQLRARGLTHEQIDDALSHESKGTRRAQAIQDMSLAIADYDRAAGYFADATAQAALAKQLARAIALITTSELDSRIVDYVKARRRVLDLREQAGADLDQKSSIRADAIANANASTAQVGHYVTRVLTELTALEGERVGLVLQNAERG